MAGKLKDKVDRATQTQALAKPASTVLSIFQDSTIKSQLSAALGSHVALTADRLLVVALNECRRNEELLSCTRESMVGALLQAAHLGLEVGGPLGHYYLVPFWNRKVTPQRREVTPILGYKGMIVLARRSKELADIAARAVYSNDEFEWEYGLEDRLRHRPSQALDRGTVVSFYGVARFTNGGHQMLVMSKAEVDKFKGRSRAADSGSSPWQSDYDAMGAKTVIRRMSAYLPLTTEAAEAIAEDEERELGLTPEGVLDLDKLGFGNGKLPPPAEGSPPEEPRGAGEQPGAAAGQEEGVQLAQSPTSATTPLPPSAAGDPAQDPAARGSILRDPDPAPRPLSEDPGAAFRGGS